MESYTNTILFASAIIIATLALQHLRKRQNDIRNDLLALPGPPKRIIFGNVLEIMSDPLKTFTSYAEYAFSKNQRAKADADLAQLDYGTGMFRYWYFNEPVVVAMSPQIVKQVLATQVNCFDKEPDEIITSVIGNGILLANGEPWKHQKRLMSPAFGYGYTKLMVPCFSKCAHVLANKWDSMIRKSEESSSELTENVHLAMTKLTLDIIGLAGFGYDFHSQVENNHNNDDNTSTTGDNKKQRLPLSNKLPDAIATVLHETEERIFQLVPIWKIPFTPGTRRFNDSKAILLTEIDKMIKQRRSEGISMEKSEDLLGRLLASEDSETGETISDQQLSDELMTILIAGHETTAAMLAFAFFILSTFPEVESKLYQEIISIVGASEDPDFEQLNKLKYMDLVIKETMRLFPSVAMQTSRIANQDVQLGDYVIPKGTCVEIWPWLIHRSPHFWKDPLHFIPERHLENNASYTYIPFGAGPRECIGKKLALLEAKVVLVTILQRFQLSMAKGYIVKPQLSVTLRPSNLFMNIKRRQHLKASQ